MNGNRCTNDSMRDLDHMFDNSDDLSSDEAVAAVSIVGLAEFIFIFNFIFPLIIIIFIVTNANTSWLK